MDYSKYHPDWKDVIRPSILARDNYTCQSCRIKHKSKVYKLSSGKYHVCDEFEYAWAKANDRNPFVLYLQVAHLDNDKSNNHETNLLSLCPRCHSKRDAEFKSFMRKVYKDKTTRPIFKDDFKKKVSTSQVKAYLERRYPWILEGAPSVSEYNNLIRYILNNK